MIRHCQKTLLAIRRGNIAERLTVLDNLLRHYWRVNIGIAKGGDQVGAGMGRGLRFGCIIYAALGRAKLFVDVNTTSGGVRIRVNGTVYLESIDAVVGTSSLSGMSLRVETWEEVHGSDALGSYQGYAMEFTDDEKRMIGSVRWYDGLDVAVFTQHFPETIPNADASALSSTAFPAFARSTRRCFSYFGYFPHMQSGTLNDYEASSQSGVPLVLFDDTATVVVSSLDRHKAQQVRSTDAWIGFGVKGTAALIPANWTQQWIVSCSSPGVRAGLATWGQVLLKYHGIADELQGNMYRDAAHATIGFWTDNGGYYHYSTGPNASMTYEQVLPKVKKYHEELGVPFGHWQFDSWFYPKDGPTVSGVGTGAVTNWTALDSVFPSGMASINRVLGGMPMVMHNRQWSVISDYIANSSAGVEWLLSGSPPNGASAPRDPFAFFEWFFQQQQGWGLVMYEQDWMDAEYDIVEALHSNLSLADDWLNGMAAGVASSGRTQQYCMPYATDILAAATLPAVTNARATDDYFHDAHGRENWMIGPTSLLYTALGILPFKDGFYSTSLLQPGGANDGPETDPDREIIMATLSGGMVAAMDGLGFLNATRLAAACRSDGVVLKPDRPITTSDACFVSYNAAPEECFLYETHSDLSADRRIHYVYADDDRAANLFSIRALDGAQDDRTYIIYNWYTRSIEFLDQHIKIQPGYENHSFVVVSPLVEGFAFIGEPEKYTTASRKRFSNVHVTGDTLRVNITGAPHETVRACAVTQALTLACAEVSFADAEATIELYISRSDSRIDDLFNAPCSL